MTSQEPDNCFISEQPHCDGLASSSFTTSPDDAEVLPDRTYEALVIRLNDDPELACDRTFISATLTSSFDSFSSFDQTLPVDTVNVQESI